MKKQRLLLVLGGLIIFMGAAAFLAARLLNQDLDPLQLGAPFVGDFRSMIVPAPELPAAAPEVAGAFVARQDQTVTIETKPLTLNVPGVASPSSARNLRGTHVEVVVTSQTTIYRETTRPDEPLTAGNQRILQTVEEDTLADLNERSMVMAWGRRSGDRVIADVLLYSDMVAIKTAIFKDCEICP